MGRGKQTLRAKLDAQRAKLDPVLVKMKKNIEEALKAEEEYNQGKNERWGVIQDAFEDPPEPEAAIDEVIDRLEKHLVGVKGKKPCCHVKLFSTNGFAYDAILQSDMKKWKALAEWERCLRRLDLYHEFTKQLDQCIKLDRDLIKGRLISEWKLRHPEIGCQMVWDESFRVGMID